MKIPFLPLYVMTTKTLGEVIELAAKKTRETSNKQVAGLLYSNAVLSMRIPKHHGRKKRKRVAG